MYFRIKSKSNTADRLCSLILLFDCVKVSLCPQVKLVQLFLVNLAGGIGQKALAAVRLGKCNYVPYIISAGQNHNQPVQPEGQAAVWWSSIFQGLQEESKLFFGLSLRDIQSSNTFA